ncbi:unnamed protein product [Nesidiocoris tenuis]|uniref:Uncharacterized protein n=1 Tax=Nesidiocoris tenuis TaxID=355587 RepID=A0A6H5GT94_9HEMI|nr:unnamed protein product [Nesidiocoris tenuis]
MLERALFQGLPLADEEADTEAMVALTDMVDIPTQACLMTFVVASQGRLPILRITKTGCLGLLLRSPIMSPVH